MLCKCMTYSPAFSVPHILSAELRAREEKLLIIFRGQDWGQKMPHTYNPLISLKLKRGGGGQTVRISFCPVEAQKVFFIAFFECFSTSTCLV